MRWHCDTRTCRRPPIGHGLISITHCRPALFSDSTYTCTTCRPSIHRVGVFACRSGDWLTSTSRSSDWSGVSGLKFQLDTQMAHSTRSVTLHCQLLVSVFEYQVSIVQCLNYCWLTCTLTGCCEHFSDSTARPIMQLATRTLGPILCVCRNMTDSLRISGMLLLSSS